MAGDSIGTANNYALYGGTIDGVVAIQSFEGLEINVEVTGEKGLGCQMSGDTLIQPLPGGRTFGTPTFTCPIEQGNQQLWDWWETWFPLEGAQRASFEPEELTFEFRNNNDVLAAWTIKGAWPMKYDISTAGVDENGLSTETITIACKEFMRRE